MAPSHIMKWDPNPSPGFQSLARLTPPTSSYIPPHCPLCSRHNGLFSLPAAHEARPPCLEWSILRRFSPFWSQLNYHFLSERLSITHQPIGATQATWIIALPGSSYICIGLFVGSLMRTEAPRTYYVSLTHRRIHGPSHACKKHFNERMSVYSAPSTAKYFIWTILFNP